MITRKIEITQPYLFVISLSIFFIAATFGWIKLQYGFNFMDEGYHMTESWRLVAGDHFLKNKITGALRHYTLINSMIFQIYPDITLLEFRRLEFVLTLISLILFGFALYKIRGEYWYLPFIFSIFAFTGLDPVGMISNLCYQTYPHLFITLHLSFYLLAIEQKSIILKRTLFVISGVFLWLISLSLVHMSLIVFSPILIFLMLKILKIDFIRFDFKDLCWTLAPFVLFWIFFISIFNMAYIQNVISSTNLLLSTPAHSKGALIRINWEALKHIGVTIIFLLICLYTLRISRIYYLGILLSITTALMYVIIDTSLFALIEPYFSGWFSQPMWLSALLISVFIFFCGYVVLKIIYNKKWIKSDIYALILIIPTFIMSMSSTIFSSLGLLTVLQSSIPAIAATTCLVLSINVLKSKSYIFKFMILVFLFTPFYYTTAWSDWKFTFFDTTPSQMNATIEKGFGKGIITNNRYKNLYDWLSVTAERYTEKDDYIISYIVTPMVHMITKRRPAFDDSFITFDEIPLEYYQKEIDRMISSKREPKMAFVFEAMPAFFPVSLKEESFKWFNKQFLFSSNDPISKYIEDNMTFLDQYVFSNQQTVRCYVDNKIDGELAGLYKKLNSNPNNPSLLYMIGNGYVKKGSLDKAIDHYQKVLTIKSDYIPALHQLALVYSDKGEFDNALIHLHKITELQPQDPDGYYNIACIYAKKRKVDESIDWLKKAIDKGFNDFDLLQKDKDLENIRNTKYYSELFPSK